MMTTDRFKEELIHNLSENILPYWLEKMEDPRGGYYGRRDASGILHPDAPRGAILNARILWTLSAAARFTGRKDLREAAGRQFIYFRDHFVDPVHGGCYWSVDAAGKPLDTKKQFYAIAFAIYGFSEYHRLTSDGNARELAANFFSVIETHSRDREKGGYIEAMTQDWRPIDDMRLSDKDLNSSKTMNTHLHILEAYTNLLRIMRNDTTLEATQNLLEIFNDTIVDRQSGHMGLFFDDDMNRVDHAISYGHDIEASWLMLEAAKEIGDPELEKKTLEVTKRLALAALEGMQPDHSMVYELHADGRLDAERHWWVQAESVVGLTYLARFHQMPEMLYEAMECWRYIDANIVDHENGEWLWSRLPDGKENKKDDKAGFWKCPYHNSRMILETLSQL